MKSKIVHLSLLGVSLLSPLACAGTIDLYIAAPGVQISPIAGSTVANFDSTSTGNYSSLSSSVGTYTSTGTFAIAAANNFGGANLAGNYFAVGTESGSAAPVTLTLPGEENYFGMWWSSADANNGISLFDNGNLLVHFAINKVEAVLNAGTTEHSLGGTLYNSTSFYGNPNNGQIPAEPFVYIMIIGNGLQFNQIVFDNNGQTGTGFESDNQAIASGTPTPPQSAVFIGSIVAPEPAESTAVALGLGLLAWARARKSKPAE